MRTKRILVPFMVVLALAGLADRQAAAQAAAARKPRIAILDFDYATVQSYSSAIFGTNVDIGKGIADLLVTDLVKNGSYSIIERKALDKIMAEQNFSNSNRADPTSAAKIGKLLGVDAMLVGSITEFGNETKKTNLGGGGGNWGGFGLGGFGHSNSKANVGITARLVNVDTGEIMAVAEGTGQSSRSSTSMLGGGGNWHGFGGGNADFGSSDFQNTIIGEATKQAVDKLTADLVSNAGKVGVRTIKVEGLVAAVDSGQIVLNVGSRAGVHVGDQLEVVRVTREIKDPATGQVIRRLSSTVGVVQATDVDDASAVCSVVSGSGFKTGDSVRSVTQ
ncbi:MAG TPA: CsgG/HfaB family protein [Terracidiphilus sp.]|nr:CsgG/HfaB family protein [Terracidiphilus sp.]